MSQDSPRKESVKKSARLRIALLAHMRGGFSSHFRWRQRLINRSAGGTQRRQTKCLPTDAAITLFHTWMRRHQLGRKRVLDTLLAATYRATNVTSLLTLNTADFMVFDEFACVPLFGTPA
jgi:hypothetical protein